MRNILALFTALLLTGTACAKDLVIMPLLESISKARSGYEVKAPPFSKPLVVYHESKKQHELPNADVGTFKVYAQTDGFAQDSRQVYYKGFVLPGADPSSFRLLPSKERDCRYKFSRDSTHVYRYQLLINDADAETFTIIDGTCSYSKDKNRVYGGLAENGIIDGADPVTFQMVGPSDNIARDKNAVYFSGTRLDDVDPASYRLLGSGYAVDKKRAFYYITPIAGADAKTFRVLPLSYAKDNKHVYLRGELLASADAATFRTRSGDPKDPRLCDKHGAYDYNGLMKEANPAYPPCP